MQAQIQVNLKYPPKTQENFFLHFRPEQDPSFQNKKLPKHICVSREKGKKQTPNTDDHIA